MSVAARVRRPRAPPFLDPPGYARHRPEATLLYQLVAQHYPAFRELRAETGRPLPGHVQKLQEARVLPLVWRAAHGGERRTAGR